MDYQVIVTAPVNGRPHKATVLVKDTEGAVKFRDKEDLDSATARRALAKRMTERIEDIDPKDAERLVEEAWNEANEKIDAGEAARQHVMPLASNAVTVEVLDAAPNVMNRPLRLLDDHAYAAAWVPVRTTVREVTNPKTGAVERYDPPKVVLESALAIVRDDGAVFCDAPLPLEGAQVQPLAGLGVTVRLATEPPPGQTWSGAGLKRFVAGERPDPADVFRRVVAVANHYMDFGRSLSTQETMCELIGCYVLATYFLDALDVAGYVWPNGDRGTGKSNLLYVITEMAYLGLVILAGGSYASLRDLADYGATLAFDDAEAVMDVKRSDPDKQALLLAGNRRGATITVKEPAGDKAWVMRHIHAFCHRLFSAIRLPDDVLGSRAIVVPLVRSADPHRARRAPQDHKSWPCDRRRLVDDLWACGLAHLPKVKVCDGQAATHSALVGRDLEPWRGILAVSLWLQEEHAVEGLFQRMKALSEGYQAERHDLEARDPVRLVVLSLREMLGDQEKLEFSTSVLAARVNQCAKDEELVAEGEADFTNPKKLGWVLKRLRFQKGDRNEKGRHWQVTASEVAGLALAYRLRPPVPPDRGAAAEETFRA